MSNSTYPTTAFAGPEGREATDNSELDHYKDALETFRSSMTDEETETYNVISKFGRPVTKSKTLLRALWYLRRATRADLQLLLSPKEKATELKQWRKGQLCLAMEARGLAKDELHPILVDHFSYGALVLYHESDQSFWKWELRGQRTKGKYKLKKFSHYWTDIFLKGACFSSEHRPPLLSARYIRRWVEAEPRPLKVDDSNDQVEDSSKKKLDVDSLSTKLDVLSLSKPRLTMLGTR